MEKKLLIMVIGILMIGILSSGLYAQEGRGNGRLMGEVVDSKGKPLADVKITLEYYNFDRKLETKSDANGAWGFVSLGKGAVTIKAVKAGYIPGGIQLQVSGVNRNPKQKIILKHESEVKQETKETEDTEKKADLKRANALFNSNKFAEALPMYQKFAQLKPKKFEIGIYVAHCLLGMRKYQEAIDQYNKSLEKITAANPNIKGNEHVAACYSGIGDAYMNQNQLKKAEDYFKKSIDVNPGDHILTYNVAEILFNAGKTDDAIKYYMMTIKNKPSFPNSYKQIGYAYLNKGDIKNSVKYLKEYLKLAPDSEDAPGIKEVIKSLK